jgi:hypothetical protein
LHESLDGRIVILLYYGGLYQFAESRFAEAPVPELVWRGLKLAQSKGGFLQTYVKGYFQYEVVE